jgi:hypothetical protein
MGSMTYDSRSVWFDEVSLEELRMLTRNIDVGPVVNERQDAMAKDLSVRRVLTMGMNVWGMQTVQRTRRRRRA